MNIIISQTKEELGQKAAIKGAELINQAISENGYANIIVATGASQFEMLNELVSLDIDWSKVIAFHLDEYIGIPDTHPASFRKYLKERFADIVKPKKFNYVNGDVDTAEECKRLGELISKHAIDVAFVGIGENGHLAFNDPPADFETEEAYIKVNLDSACRQQQLGEGWFKTIDDVPKSAISMSIKQIMKSKAIICSVPDERKAKAVYDTIYDEISPESPASVLRNHSQTMLFLDINSASNMKEV
jgi:glucosamine-6-phosphate deaminase